MTGGSSGSVPSIPPFNPSGSMPAYQPADVGKLDQSAIRADEQYYSSSDTNFAANHPKVVGAENAFQSQLSNEWNGGANPLPAALQAAYAQSGISAGNNVLGGTTGNLGDGGTGLTGLSNARNANLAQNLGMNVMQYQNTLLNQREGDLGTAEQIFPRRTFGLSGSDETNLNLANLAGQNSWNQADYANNLAIQELNYKTQQQNVNNQISQNNTNAAAGASQTSSTIGTIGTVIGGILAAY